MTQTILDLAYKHALAHYLTICFFHAQSNPADDNWQQQARIMAARYMSIWYGVK